MQQLDQNTGKAGRQQRRIATMWLFCQIS